MNSNNTEQKNKFKTGDGSAAAGPEVTGGSARGGSRAGFLGTIGGKIAIGVAGVAIAATIGFGVHHAVTTREPESVKPTDAPTVTAVVEKTENTTETEETTVVTTEETTQEMTVAGYWDLAYTYNTDTKTVEVKYNTGPYATYYATGYVRFDISHNQGPSSIWPCTYGKFENGQIVLLYDVSNWDKSLSSYEFPDEQDLDGDGCIYYITDRATGETRTVDKLEYDAFMQGLNLGEEMQLDYKSFTTENVNAIQ